MKPQRSIARSTISQMVPSVVRPLERAAFMKAVEPVLDKYRKQLGPKLFAYLE